MLMNNRNNCVETNNNNNSHNFCGTSLLNSIVKAAEARSSSSLEQRSNTSSLESLDSPVLDDNRVLSTSCSEDSFEMSSATSHVPGDLSTPSESSYSRNDAFIKCSADSTKFLENGLVDSTFGALKEESEASSSGCVEDEKLFEETSPEVSKPDALGEFSSRQSGAKSNFMWSNKPTTSKSMGSISTEVSAKGGLEALRESIEKELNDLDTCLPNLDFGKLEEKLNSAAQERQVNERKLLGEQVRRRLALQVDEMTAGPSPRISTRPSKSNLGHRLQTAMNLQVCYINGMDSGSYDEEEEVSSDDDEFDVPKSKSVPNLRGCVSDGSTMNATQLREKAALETKPEQKQTILEEETRMMLAKAKQTARLQMELERLNSLSLERKYTRLQLSRVELPKLRGIAEKLTDRICEANTELVQLLVERDSLHMEQDSMLVDIEDMIQHQSNSDSLNLPEFLKIQGTTPKKFRLFKK